MLYQKRSNYFSLILVLRNDLSVPVAKTWPDISIHFSSYVRKTLNDLTFIYHEWHEISQNCTNQCRDVLQNVSTRVHNTHADYWKILLFLLAL